MKNTTRVITLILSLIFALTFFGCRKVTKNDEEPERHYYNLEGYWVERDADPQTGVIVSFSYVDGKNVMVIIDDSLEKRMISSRYFVRGDKLNLSPDYEEDVRILGGSDNSVKIKFRFENDSKELIVEYAAKSVHLDKFEHDLSVVPRD